ALLASDAADAVVVTHGTDTLEETAFFLELVRASDKPVVLVGAMRPSDALSADGPMNLRNAVVVAASAASQGRGVLAVMNEDIHAARWVQKTSASGVQAFSSPQQGPVGAVVGRLPVYGAAPSPVDGQHFQTLPTDSLPRVDILMAYAGADGAMVKDAVKRGARGIVLAGVGNGNASKDVLAELAAAAKKGVLVVRTSRVGRGFIEENLEVDDKASGFAANTSLTPQKARVLLQMLLANRTTDIQAVRAAFNGWR
ncbi:MAG: asparaginase, partial [Rhodospirillaceae bacterium]|nr:asparaginase [Rhodospirillaceae bacterium]